MVEPHRPQLEVVGPRRGVGVGAAVAASGAPSTCGRTGCGSSRRSPAGTATSPIGQGLLGKKKGEVAEIQVPRGMLRFKVLSIAFAH